MAPGRLPFIAFPPGKGGLVNLENVGELLLRPSVRLAVLAQALGKRNWRRCWIESEEVDDCGHGPEGWSSPVLFPVADRVGGDADLLGGLLHRLAVEEPMLPDVVSKGDATIAPTWIEATH